MVWEAAAAKVAVAALTGTKVNKSGAASEGEAGSGQGNFYDGGDISLTNPIMDLSSPVHFIFASAVIVAAIWIYKKKILR